MSPLKNARPFVFIQYCPSTELLISKRIGQPPNRSQKWSLVLRDDLRGTYDLAASWKMNSTRIMDMTAMISNSLPMVMPYP